VCIEPGLTLGEALIGLSRPRSTRVSDQGWPPRSAGGWSWP